jgi:hypothetical protein
VEASEVKSKGLKLYSDALKLDQSSCSLLWTSLQSTMAEGTPHASRVGFPFSVPPTLGYLVPVGQHETVPHLKYVIEHLSNKSNTLGVQLGVCVQQLQLTSREKQILERNNQELREQLRILKTELDECRAQLLQQELANSTWTTCSVGDNKETADETLFVPIEEDLQESAFLDQSLTVKRVAYENGYKCGKKDLYKLSGHLYNVFMHTRGRPPHIKIVKDESGIPCSMGCFVERDRGLILAVLDKFGERAGSTSAGDQLCHDDVCGNIEGS